MLKEYRFEIAIVALLGCVASAYSGNGVMLTVCSVISALNYLCHKVGV